MSFHGEDVRYLSVNHLFRRGFVGLDNSTIEIISDNVLHWIFHRYIYMHPHIAPFICEFIFGFLVELIIVILD